MESKEKMIQIIADSTGQKLSEVERTIEILSRSSDVSREAAESFSDFGKIAYNANFSFNTKRRKPTNYTKPRNRKKAKR